jgi:hypothetical protein
MCAGPAQQAQKRSEHQGTARRAGARAAAAAAPAHLGGKVVEHERVAAGGLQDHVRLAAHRARRGRLGVHKRELQAAVVRAREVARELVCRRQKVPRLAALVGADDAPANVCAERYRRRAVVGQGRRPPLDAHRRDGLHERRCGVRGALRVALYFRVERLRGVLEPARARVAYVHRGRAGLVLAVVIAVRVQARRHLVVGEHRARTAQADQERDGACPARAEHACCGSRPPAGRSSLSTSQLVYPGR